MNSILVADRIPTHFDSPPNAKTLELLEDDYFDYLLEGLSTLHPAVIHYDGPKEFIDNIKRHKNDVILPLYSGELSRTRKALVPSICEAYGLAYIGADPYTHTISQDKYTSNRLANRLGLPTPCASLVESESDLPLIQTLRVPIVIKPNFEGGSIGISSDNLVRTHAEAKKLASFLLSTFQQPVIAEEFIEGDEVSILIVGNKRKIILCEAVRIRCFLDEQEVKLDKQIFSMDLKKTNRQISLNEEIATHEIPEAILSLCIRLFKSLDKVDIIRIDGRLTDDKFTFIELSPDIYLGPHSSFEIAYRQKNKAYRDLLQDLTYLAIEHRERQSANSK